MEEFVTEQIRLSREVNIPLLKYFEHLSDEELIAISTKSAAQLLEYLAENNAAGIIEHSVEQWINNQVPQIEKGQVITEDITLIGYVRKHTFLHFLSRYTSDVVLIIDIVKEVDRYIVASETALFNTFINLVGEQIKEQVNFIEKINNTSPGVVYVYDLLNDKTVYSNYKDKALLGYSHEELNNMGEGFIPDIEHPDDVAVVKKHYRDFASAADGEIRTVLHRLKHKDDGYRWMRNYDSVFKRTSDGAVWQTIGITLNVDSEKQTEEKLQQREAQLLEAQQLGEIGSFEWNLDTLKGNATPQLLRILELDDSEEFLNFRSMVHPDDRERVNEIIVKATIDKTMYDYECRFLAKSKEKTIWARGDVSVINGSPVVKGTIMDVSERHQMIQRLKQSEELFKEAQALTHMGNWSWDLEQNVVSWSDELYRIFGLQPQSEEITVEKYRAFVHQDDREHHLNQINKTLQTLQPVEYLLRIITKDKVTKILQVKSGIKTSIGSKALIMIGTCEDVTEKQLLIQRLQQSELLYKQAQALSHIGNWSFDLNDQTIQWSDEMFRIYGLKVEDRLLTYEELFAFNHPEDAEVVQSAMSSSLQNKASHDFYYRIILKDGSIKVIHSKGEVLLDDSGNPNKIHGTAQDVTEQKRIEKELLDNRNFIHKIADATPSIITSYNINTGEYKFVSEGIRKLLGYDPQKLLEKGASFVSALIHPDDIQPTTEKNTAALMKANDPENSANNEMVTEFIYRVLDAHGNYRWLHTYGTVFDRNNEGKVENILNISLDVTDYRESEKRLLDQEHFIKHIAEASPTILYLFDLEESRFIYINKEVKEVLGYEPEEIIALGDKASLMYLHPEDEIKPENNNVRHTHSKSESSMHQFEGRIRHKNKRWKWMLTREIVFKRNEEGKALQVLGSALDITDRKETEQALVYKTLQLQQSNASLEEFAHVASHDLQEPLRKISTFGDRLLSSHKDLLSADGLVYLTKILQSTGRMQQLIHDILSISMVTGEKTLVRYSLNDLLEEVLQTLEYKIEDKHAVITSEHLPDANIIPSQFRQLFQNLISNSIKFCRPETTPEIVITHQFVPATVVAKYKLQSAPQYLQLNIKDNGIGFENVFSKKIFAIFQRLNSRAEFEGTGIGLAICKKIVENHGGTILAKGIPNEGAEFTIFIPA